VAVSGGGGGGPAGDARRDGYNIPYSMLLLLPLPMFGILS